MYARGLVTSVGSVEQNKTQCVANALKTMKLTTAQQMQLNINATTVARMTTSQEAINVKKCKRNMRN